MFKERFTIPDGYISAILYSLFTKSAKKWYFKMRQDHGKQSWPWWKEKIISKWENNSWTFRMENSFEEVIFNIETDRPMSWLLKQKEILTSLHPDMSETMLHKRSLRKCGGDLENAIRSRFIEPCSTEDYISSMEDLNTREKEMSLIGSKSHLANTCKERQEPIRYKLKNSEDKKEKNHVSLH
ncbi:hypothetical protein O181_004695 [Austropuccinia psidii MF-1]|uniref:Uncharacterized protein n=1 Tax=Austropuccinia psidii MF-1 TaxID=1389203 RepID=A0A9Q3GF33_9BASI|nr:hypothetical protein [Austropuccinia psidii MF-1]